MRWLPIWRTSRVPQLTTLLEPAGRPVRVWSRAQERSFAGASPFCSGKGRNTATGSAAALDNRTCFNVLDLPDSSPNTHVPSYFQIVID